MSFILFPDANQGVACATIAKDIDIEKAIKRTVPKGVPYKIVTENAFDWRYQEAIRWNDGDPVMDEVIKNQLKLINGELVDGLSSQFQNGLESLSGVLSPEQEADFYLIEAGIDKAIKRGRFQAVLALLKKPQDLPEEAETFRTNMVKLLEGLINGS